MLTVRGLNVGDAQRCCAKRGRGLCPRSSHTFTLLACCVYRKKICLRGGFINGTCTSKNFEAPRGRESREYGRIPLSPQSRAVSPKILFIFRILPGIPGTYHDFPQRQHTHKQPNMNTQSRLGLNQTYGTPARVRHLHVLRAARVITD